MREDTPSLLAARRRRRQGTITDFDGGRLALARRLARLPRAHLARDIHVTPATITQLERGAIRPTAPLLADLAGRLDMPEDFFRHGRPVPALPATAAHFRSLRTTPALSRDQALAFAELAMDVVDAVEQYVDLPTADVPALELPDSPTRTDIAEAAARTRAVLGVPDGPVAHVVRLLEAHGVVVLRLPSDVAGRPLDRDVDAFSTSATARPLVLLSPMKDDKARSRFDAAHELGHLVMHHDDAEAGNKVVEGQAQTFAAEFLMPADQVVDDLPRRVDWEQLHAAKRHWGTSLRALIYRARTLGVLSETAYKRANITLAGQGYPEPGPLGPPESPTLLEAATDLLREHGTTLDQLAQATRVPLAQVTEVIIAGSDPKPRLRISPH
ncbi:XRE family transcriptional regulator [Pseudokineococcus marinus]|uniref:ImmA/IrrE family metallo-endopeptidase n=1 Tax=Pseudokineococcus marinus TaxID=351215 RepID=A0A849BM43_9ACTN|nr:XRE family transcriptional regulator [Pseudokineococcus marinus]NNH21872.1 ImmA/IrrE family metallo-endopeptidase [Pseudokineococcus marinus]